jgi:peptide/nickel transport system substrate-binding protein
MIQGYRGPCLIALMFLLVAGCAPAAQRQAAEQAPVGGSSLAARKVITIALRNDINALAGDADQGGRTSPPSVYVHEFINAPLTVRNQEDEVRPLVARELPSLDTGTWKLLDDGRMDVTWKLRPDVRWHDGTALTADDVQFGWEVASDPTTAIGKRGPLAGIESIEVLDPTTLIMHWKRASVYGGELGQRELAILPRHVLEPAFVGNKDAFHQHPYFTSADSFVGAGAYRPVEWERDSHLNVEAFDGYFLGRPRIDRITFRFIQDSRTALANVMAGVIDMSYLAVEFGEAIVIRDEWARSGEGTVWFQPNQLRVIEPQMRPEYERPPDLANPDVRRALAYAMDRPAIAEAASPGSVTIVDSDGVPGTHVGDEIRSRAVHYEYSPSRAQTLVEGAGWRRGADGLLEKGSQRFQLDLIADRGTEQDAVFAVMRENYRQVGIDLSFVEITGDPQQRAVYPGLRHRGAFTNDLRALGNYHSSQIPTAETRWAGSNYSGYNNPVADRTIDAIERSIRTGDRLAQTAEAWRLLTDEAAVIGLYIRPVPYILRKGIKGPIPSSLSGSLTSNVQTWEAP